MPTNSDALMRFQGAYGRLCILMARALKQGHSETQVIEASQGKGQQAAPVYVELRAQRKRLNAAIDACHRSHVPSDVLVRIGQEMKAVAESEWELKIPKFARPS